MELGDALDYKVQVGVLATLFVIGVAVNLPAAFIYSRNKQLRGSTDKFILYVLIVDIVSLFTFLPASLIFIIENASKSELEEPTSSSLLQRPLFFEDSLKNSSLFEHSFSSSCVSQWIFLVHKVLIIMVSNMSILGALQIAVERYLAVVTPLHYHKLVKSTNVILFSFLSFILSIAFALVTIPDDYNFVNFAQSQCAPNFIRKNQISSDAHLPFRIVEGDVDYLGSLVTSGDESHPDSSNYLWPVLKLCHATVFFIIPLILVASMYARIWTEARKQNKRIHPQNNAFIAPQEWKKPKVNTLGLQRIIGRFKVERIRKTRIDRAGKVAIFSVALLIFSYGPLHYRRIFDAVSAINTIYKSNQVISASGGTFILPTFFACLHPLLSPLLYIYRYKKVRNELINLLKKLISRFSSSKDNSIVDCQRIARQINQIVEQLPSSSSEESQLSTVSDVIITIDLQSPDDLKGDHTQEYFDSEAQECKNDPSGLLNAFNSWMHSYSRRWNEHRESVTSTASVITLLSNPRRSLTPET